jgi:hypothetical protein
MANQDGQPNAVGSVLVASRPRYPEFNASEPEMWFSVVETHFSKAQVTDEQQRYLDVVSLLPNRYADEVRDVIMHGMDNDSYPILKRELIKRLSSSQEEKTRRLLEHVIMEDDKPSQ